MEVGFNIAFYAHNPKFARIFCVSFFLICLLLGDPDELVGHGDLCVIAFVTVPLPLVDSPVVDAGQLDQISDPLGCKLRVLLPLCHEDFFLLCTLDIMLPLVLFQYLADDLVGLLQGETFPALYKLLKVDRA
jgi:hypothetical protein